MGSTSLVVVLIACNLAKKNDYIVINTSHNIILWPGDIALINSKFMEEQKIHSLIARCEAFFCENCYTENRITRYKEMWRNGILKFMTERKLTMYSPSIGEEYAQGCHHSGEVLPADRDLIRSVHVLDDILKLG